MTTTSKAQRRGLLSRLNLFGGTPAKKWEAENVVPASDITQNLSVMYGSGMTTVASLTPGTAADFQLRRGDSEVTIKVTPTARPNQAQRGAQQRR